MEAEGQYAVGDKKRWLCHWPHPIRAATNGYVAHKATDTARYGVADIESATGGQLACLVVKQAAGSRIRCRAFHGRCGDGLCRFGTDQRKIGGTAMTVPECSVTVLATP